jgi:hypothetical protein
MKMNKVKLTLVAAKNLYNTELLGEIDPYVHILSSSKIKILDIKSKPVENSESPSFDQAFTFECDASKDVLTLDGIFFFKIIVRDTGKFLVKDHSLGFAIVDLTKLEQSKTLDLTVIYF